MSTPAAGIHPITLPPMGSVTPEQNAKRSLTHWVWSPYRDINNMAPTGINSQLGYRDQRWTELKRCVPYPLGNLISYEPDRSAAEGIAGMVNSEALPKVEYVKYAQAQAEELVQIYEDVGLSKLVPLTGMDDAELVTRIVQVVQPFAYALHEMSHEFTTGAKQRIAASNLSDNQKTKAFALADIMLRGAAKAVTKARAEYEALISSMSDKSVGQPGISNPTPFHEWICQMLNEPVPKRIDKTGQGGSNEAINILAKRALREESAAEAMAEELAKEREARAALEEKVNKLMEKSEAA